MAIQLPAKLQPLFKPARYKVLHGGRGGGKSWGIADALLLLGASDRMRTLCTREIQKSIKDSVHKLLSDRIEQHGLQKFYNIFDTEIRGKNGTEFLFAGLQNHTVESVKSYEGIDTVWLEEAQTISKQSLDILIPTIRKPGSEVWVSFNPQLDTDEVWKRFVENPIPGSFVQQINWSDNPWFPEVLNQERLLCKERNPEDYDNIWEGKCRSSVIGAIYANEMAAVSSECRVTPIPYDPKLKVHAIWDLGWNDAMAIALVQRGPMGDIRVLHYIEQSFKTLDYYAGVLRGMPFNWGYDLLPHDGATKDFKTGKSAVEILKGFGRRPKLQPKLGLEQGIKAARQVFPKLFFNKGGALPHVSELSNVARLLECGKRYRRGVPASTGEPGSPVHDEFSHGADVLRYLAVSENQLRNDIDDTPAPQVIFEAYDPVVGY